MVISCKSFNYLIISKSKKLINSSDRTHYHRLQSCQLSISERDLRCKLLQFRLKTEITWSVGRFFLPGFYIFWLNFIVQYDHVDEPGGLVHNYVNIIFQYFSCGYMSWRNSTTTYLKQTQRSQFMLKLIKSLEDHADYQCLRWRWFFLKKEPHRYLGFVKSVQKI